MNLRHPAYEARRATGLLYSDKLCTTAHGTFVGSLSSLSERKFTTNASTATIAIIVALIVIVVLVLLLPGHGDSTPGQPPPHAIDQSQ